MNETTLNVTGRGRLTATATCDGLGVLIRLDDDARPGWWCEVRLTDGDLVRLLTPPTIPPSGPLVASEIEAWRTGRFTEAVTEMPLPQNVARFLPH